MDQRRPNHSRGISTRKGKSIFDDPNPAKISKSDKEADQFTSRGDTRNIVFSGGHKKSSQTSSKSSSKNRSKVSNSASPGASTGDKGCKDFLNKLAEMEGENARLRTERNFWRTKALEKDNSKWDGVVKVANGEANKLVFELEINPEKLKMKHCKSKSGE